MTENIVIQFLDGKFKNKQPTVCFGSLSCPSDSVKMQDIHPARNCPYFPICYIVRGNYENYKNLLKGD